MSGTANSLVAARVAERLARARLQETIAQIKARVQPSVLVHEGLETVREHRDALKQNAIDVARERPAAVGGAAAGVVLLLLRKPLVRLVRRLFSKRHETAAPQAG